MQILLCSTIRLHIVGSIVYGWARLHRGDTMTKKNNNISELRDQIINFFPSYYMTLISIIQATALGYLLYNVSQQVTAVFSDFPLLLIYLITFFVIMIVWYEYMMGSASLRWMPTILDSVIPFTLGIGQFSLILAVYNKLYCWWYFSLSFVCFVSFFAYLNMYVGANKLSEYNKINAMVLDELKNYPKINYSFTLGYLIVFFCFGYIEFMRNNKSVFFIYLTLGLMIVFFIRGCWYWHRITRLIK